MIIRALLAEDNEALSGKLQKLLADPGVEVLTARDGVEAMRMLAAGGIDLLILDLRLQGVSGADILRKLRTLPEWKALPIIVMTGVFKGEKFAAAARRLGVAHYLEKPFSREAFLHAVRSTIATIRLRPKPNPFLELLVDIYDNGQSGLLASGDGSPVVFRQGEPVSILTKGKGDFHAFLAARGKLHQDDLPDLTASGGGRLFLTEAGYLTYEELVEESRHFLVHRLTTALAVTAPARFIPGDTDLEFPLVPLSIPRFLAESSRTDVGRCDGEQFFAANGERFPARTSRFFHRINLISLRQEEIALLEGIDGKTPLREIVADRFPMAMVAPFFILLSALGMVEFNDVATAEAVPDFSLKNLFNRPLEELPAVEMELVGFDDLVEEVAENVGLAVGSAELAAPLSPSEIGFEQVVQYDAAFTREKNYYEMFGLTPSSFNFDALKEAYFAKTRQYSAEKLMEIGGATMVMAQDVLSRYADAYNTLSSVVAKERYDELLNADRVGLDGKKDSKLQAQIQFQSGHVFLEMGEYENAEKSLQDAYTTEPDNPLHCAWLAWAIYKNPVNRNSRSTQERARALLAKSLQGGKNAEAFAFRGWMLFDEGRDGLAEGEFLKALKLNPKESHARQGLKLLLEKRESEKKGVFSKLFG